MSNNPQSGIIRQRIEQSLDKLTEDFIRVFTGGKVQIEANLIASIAHDVKALDDFDSKAATKKEFPAILHANFKKNLSRFFKQLIEKQIANVASAPNDTFVTEYLKYWDATKRFCLAFRMSLQEHNKFYKQAYQLSMNMPTIPECVTQRWRQSIMLKHKQKLLKIMKEQLEKDRNSIHIENQKIREVFETVRVVGLHSLVAIEVKQNQQNRQTRNIVFIAQKLEGKKAKQEPAETPEKFFNDKFNFKSLLDDAHNYYLRKSRTLSENPTEYVQQALQLIRSECRRIDQFLFEPNHRKEMILQAQIPLIDHRAEQMLLVKEGGLASWLSARNEEALASMYKLYSRRTDTFKFIEQGMRDYFTKMGTAVVINYLDSPKKDPIQYIDEIIKLKQFCNQIVQKVFTKQEQRFSKMREEVFRSILKIQKSARQKSEIEFLAAKNLQIYTNNQVKKCYGNPGSEEELYKNIILVFESLSARDFFLMELLRGMPNRLLEFYTRDPRIEVDGKLINQLKLIEGAKDLYPHENMIKDLEASKEFEKLIASHPDKIPFKTTLQVLTTGNWRKEQLLNLTIPRSLQAVKRVCDDVYIKKSAGKMLNWLFTRGVSRIEGKFKTKTYRISLNNMLMLILLHLDQEPQKRIIYGELKRRFDPKRVESNDEALRRLHEKLRYREFHVALLTLIDEDLIKRTKKLDPLFDNEEMLELNREYVTKKKVQEGKTAIPSFPLQPNQKLLKEETESIFEQVMTLRRERIKCGIVRIMKDAKVCQFEKLQQELKKLPKIEEMEYNVTMVKECIDKLITDNFLIRDQKNRNVFTYVPL